MIWSQSRQTIVCRTLSVRTCALVLLLMVVAWAQAAEPANLVANGGFEDGMAAWGWEQWANRPLPGVVDKEDHAVGSAAFKMGLAGGAGDTGGRWIAQEIKVAQPNQNYLLSVRLKAKDIPAGAAHARLGIEGHGWLGSESGQSDVIQTAGTHDWKQFKVPVPAKAVGEATKLTLFFYHDQMGQGTFAIDDVSLTQVSEEDLLVLAEENTPPGLFGDTNRPDLSTFALGQKVELTFRAKGIKPAKGPLDLVLEFVDEHDKPIESKRIPVQPDKAGTWKTTIEAPAQKLGFYRVKAQLSDGNLVAGLGTRPAGFLTYIVVPDPAKRVDYGDAESRFAMQGAWQADLCSLLGARWVLDDRLQWGRTEPDRAGQFGPEQVDQFLKDVKPGDRTFRVGALPTLFKYTTWGTVPSTAIYMTGTLTPDGEKAWAAYCKVAARAFSAKYPELKQHIYQITWEPIQPWGFKGTDADLVRIYELAYTALHQADPAAVVAGPCRGIWHGDPLETQRILKAGLAKYLDAYITHPYHTITPEKDGLAQDIRMMKEILRTQTGKDIPMYGSEQGWPTDEDITKEVEQARGLLRQNLITLGEGFTFNFAFTLYDYRMEGSRTGYGYYYNLVPSVPFGPSKMCPKPIAAAYAAQSMLLDGTKSVGAIEWLGGTFYGYAFERPSSSPSGGSTILALWNYGSTPREVSIPTGVQQVHVFDWMGNEQVLETKAGRLTLQLGPEPLYVTGVSLRIWGSDAAKLLMLDARRVQAYPGAQAAVMGKALLPADKPFEGTLRLDDPAGVLPPVSRPVKLGSNEPSAFRFDLTALPALRPGSHLLHLRLCDAAGETITATTLTLEVLPPVAIRTDVAFAADGKPALAVTVQERQGRAAAGTLDVRLKELIPGADRGDAPMIDLVADPGKSKDVPNASRKVAFELAAGASKRLVIDFPDAPLAPAKRYESLLVVTLANGTTFSQTAPACFFGAAHLDRPVTIDGDLADWQAITGVSLSGPQDVVRSPQYFPQGLSAKLRYAWDAQALYIAAEVNDDIFVQERTGMDIWSQDCLQLAFNMDAKTASAGDERRTSEINVALTKGGPVACRSLSYSAEKLPTGVLSPEQFRLAIKRDGGKLWYEMAIPWTTLGMAPRSGESFKSGAGDAIGVAATVNEVRSATQQDPCALGLFGGITEKNADKQGILTLK